MPRCEVTAYRVPRADVGGVNSGERAGISRESATWDGKVVAEWTDQYDRRSRRCYFVVATVGRRGGGLNICDRLPTVSSEDGVRQCCLRCPQRMRYTRQAAYSVRRRR